MSKFRQFGLAGVAAFALMASQAMAQTSTTPPQGENGAAAETGTSATTGAPTPTEPAATETPEAPAAAGGEASDATKSGAPAGAAAPADMSGGPAAEEAPEQPSNKVGEVFELPRITDRERQVELISGLCGVQMKGMSKAACTCLAEQAYEQLTPPQRDYLIAAVVAPPVADRMLGDGRVGLPDQKTIFGFLNQTSDACVTGTYKPTTASPAGEAPAEGAPPADADPAPAAPAPAN